MKKLLNLGCQIHYFQSNGDLEWTNQDVIGDDPNMPVDLVCDAAKLPYEDNTVDFIYAGHLVEHFYPDTLPAAIKEWHRVLKPSGTLAVLTPDCGAVMKDYASGKLTIEQTWQQLYGRIYHYDRESERHHIAFDYEKLKSVVEEAAGGFGWYIARPFELFNAPKELEPFMGEHISRGAYQVGIVCTK